MFDRTIGHCFLHHFQSQFSLRFHAYRRRFTSRYHSSSHLITVRCRIPMSSFSCCLMAGILSPFIDSSLQLSRQNLCQSGDALGTWSPANNSVPQNLEACDHLLGLIHRLITLLRYVPHTTLVQTAPVEQNRTSQLIVGRPSYGSAFRVFEHRISNQASWKAG
ncbi:hypothetical protein EDD15DRAFT_760234 [Pisolithus albus]|nr:hypothetical protein EDD15DRAFT_760234 [Pisolithus albus]